MLIKQSAIVELNLAITSVFKGSRQSQFIAISEDSELYLLDSSLGLQLKAEKILALPKSTNSINIHPERPLMAMIADEQLLIADLNISNSSRQNASISYPLNSAAKKHIAHECLFDESGHYLWVGTRLSDDETEINLYEVDSWSNIGSIKLENPISENDFCLFPTGHPDLIEIWYVLADVGQQINWLKRAPDGTISQLEPCLEERTPLGYSLSGNEFIVTDEATLERYQFPDITLMGDCSWPEDNLDDNFSYDLYYLDNRYALSRSLNGRLFLIKLDGMEILDEVIIENYEPYVQQFTSSSEDQFIAADIEDIKCAGDLIFFFYSDAEEEERILLCCPVKEILSLL